MAKGENKIHLLYRNVKPLIENLRAERRCDFSIKKLKKEFPQALIVSEKAFKCKPIANKLKDVERLSNLYAKISNIPLKSIVD